MNIRNIQLGFRPVLLAPMEDVTDIGFRLLCRRLGASMVYSEFVAADALVRSVNKTFQKLKVSDDERPVAIQTYGRFPDAVEDAAEIIVETAHPDILDLNFGCPVKRVAGKGAGASSQATHHFGAYAREGNQQRSAPAENQGGTLPLPAQQARRERLAACNHRA